MDKLILKNWRNTVRGNDTIINLGDVALSGAYPKERLKNVITNLPGHKILVLGNHDRKKSIQYWLDVGFHRVFEYPIIYNKFYILSHDIVFLNDKMPYKNIHGHIHDKKMDSASYVNVSVEQTDYKPIRIDTLY